MRILLLSTTVLVSVLTTHAQRGPRMPIGEKEKAAIASPFVGITTDGKIQPDLFKLAPTGVSTKPVVDAANAFLAGLSEEQRAKTTFPIDDPEWRRWANQHSLVRQGVGFDEMDEAQRALAIDLLRSGLSARGLQTTEDIMKLNRTLGELSGKLDEYNEHLYWITIMGTPSETEPWGWQLDGHHIVINYFVLGDQVVMTPHFLGSEPVEATSGKFDGTIIMQEEQAAGLAFMNSLTPEQQTQARALGEKGPRNTVGEAFSDNIDLSYTGIAGSDLTAEQKEGLLSVAATFIGHIKEGHAAIKIEEVTQHLDTTYFAWIGDTTDDSVFYYRIHSPVVLIEFDHQAPIGLPRTGIPTRNHIHATVRTPNGNDYGKDLLKQHYHHSHGKSEE